MLPSEAFTVVRKSFDARKVGNYLIAVAVYFHTMAY